MSSPTEKILEQIKEAQKLSEGEQAEHYLSNLDADESGCWCGATWPCASRAVASGYLRTLRQLEEAVMALGEIAKFPSGGLIEPGTPNDDRHRMLHGAREALAKIAALAEEK